MKNYSHDELVNVTAISSKADRVFISGCDLVCDTQEFLESEYSGCFKVSNPGLMNKMLFISPSGYANILKSIFDAVKGSYIINIEASATQNGILLKIPLSSDIIRNNLIDDLPKIAANGGFSAKITDDGIDVYLEFISTDFAIISAISTRIVYNALKRVFLL